MSETKRVMIAVQKFGGAVVGAVIISVYQALTLATPVDTGFARSGWVPSIGVASAEPDPAPVDATLAQSLAASRLQENTNRALRVAESYSLGQGSAYITSNVPYIVPLNSGTSAQAPEQFVEESIEIGIKSISPALIRRLAG